jgi:hypothetical protein
MSLTTRSWHRSLPLAVALLFGFGLAARPADADLSKKVIAAFKGKILVTDGPLSSVGDDKATVAHFKKKALTTVAGAMNGNDVMEWTFNYTAFLSKTGLSTLKLEFHDGNKYAADQTLTGVDPKGQVIEGDITISEDDGLNKGKKYTLKLVGTAKGKEVVVATTQILMQ